MADQEFKRHTAYKLKVGNILSGKPVMDGERFSFLELGSKKIVRVNIIGNIVDKYEGAGESKYLTFTLDDGSGQTRLKTFGDDTSRFANFMQGQTVVVIGTLRFWNNELYISPEIIKEQDPKYLLIRKLELEKENSKNVKDVLGREEIIAVKDRILREIKNFEEEGGIEKDKLIMNLKDITPVIIEDEVQKFLEEGIIFEPRPGKVRYLG
ncbi:MAG: OB-fold nucleic acid binding domain-containing protein [Nanoarchaeota archaeon]